MQKFDVQIALEKVADARNKWSAAQREFQRGHERVLARLVHEAARNFMSVGEVAKFSGLSPKRVRTIMRLHGLNPSHGKRLLSDTAAKALSENAELLGIQPHEMDLTSPLAYLPMGNDLRSALQDQTNAGVTDLPEEFGSGVCGDNGCVLPRGHKDWPTKCAFPETDPDLRVEINEKLGEPMTCKVWHKDRLIFDGQTVL